MRIIKETFLRDAAEQYPKAAKYLAAWTATVRAAAWRNMADVCGCYRSADVVHVRSRKPVIVFNVCGNACRLIVALHFNSHMAYTLRFLTHAEYDRNDWKDEL
ncbi:MAG: type II toxin-antitoxin system HigB family toxin [Verrucomicrobia bacterium]|nr:type II toxin-antitoxin system HigB family toxin [Verrucomicrobiota bacterium]